MITAIMFSTCTSVRTCHTVTKIMLSSQSGGNLTTLEKGYYTAKHVQNVTDLCKTFK